MTTIAAPRIGPRDLLQRLGTDTGYLLISFPIGLAVFVALVTGLALGTGLLITVLGLPILASTLCLAGRIAILDRTHITRILEQPTPELDYRTASPRAGPIQRLLTTVTDPRRWREMLHGLVRLPVATLTWSLTVAWWSVALSGLTYPVWAWSLPQGSHTTGLAELIGLPGRGWDIGLTFAIGLLAALVLPWILRGLAVAQAGFGRALLSSSADAGHARPVQAPSSSSS